MTIHFTIINSECAHIRYSHFKKTQIINDLLAVFLKFPIFVHKNRFEYEEN